MMTEAETLVRAYYDAFNAGDFDAMLALLTDDVVHGINQGEREVGRDAFARFMAGMDTSYAERLADLVVMTEATGTRAAAEFVVHGIYKRTVAGLPEARGQRYVLPAGAFFTLRGGRVARVDNFYNLEDWLRQVREHGPA
jgi:steroid delta-isomerase-like uncharacterized protein